MAYLRFDTREIVSLGNGGLTVELLEKIVNMASEKGHVAIIDVGPTSMVDLAISLMAQYDRRKRTVRREPEPSS